MPELTKVKANDLAFKAKVKDLVCYAVSICDLITRIASRPTFKKRSLL